MRGTFGKAVGMVMAGWLATGVACAGGRGGTEDPGRDDVPAADEAGPPDAPDRDEATVGGDADAEAGTPGPDAADAPPGDIRPDPIPAGLDPDAFAMDPRDPEPAVELPDGVRLRVATMNVYGFRLATAEAIGGFLADLAPDVAMLEEIDADGAEQVAAAGGFPYHAAGAGNVALLSATPLDEPAEIGLVNGRGLLHATTSVDGVAFSLYGAHISWDVDGNLQGRQIARDVLPADPLAHVAMAGDFNDERYSTQIDYLDEALADAATAMGWYPGQRVTWPSTGFDETEGAQTIDLVFFRRTLPAIVTGVDVPNLSPVLSDHKPVVADLLYPRGDAPFASDPLAPARDPFAGFPAPADRPPNLLANPGAEDGTAGWEVGGGSQAVATRLHLSSRTGAGMFTGYDVASDPDAPWSWGSQRVDLAEHAGVIDGGRGRLYASAWMASGSETVEREGEVSNLLQTYSDGEVVVEVLDAAGSPIGRTASGRRDTLAWHPFAAVVDVPPGARAARFSFVAHHKSQGGPQNGAAFDDLYLGFAEVPEAHRVAGADRAAAAGDGEPDESAEPGASSAVSLAPGWAPLRDFQPIGPWGLAMYPPCCRSGRGCFMAHPRMDPDAEPVTGPAALSVDADLSPLADGIDAGRVAVRSGAWLRSMGGLASVRLVLVVPDADGSTWAEFESGPLRAAEWTRVELRTRLPPNARRARLEVRAALDRDDDTVFADGLSLVPERVDPWP